MSEIYGLDYDKAFLDSLPTAGHPVNNASSLPSSIDARGMMSSRLAPAIHTLTVSQFKDLHYQHILSHPPDSVLFPFLHGIEGDNEAQNLFFATQGQQAVVYNRRDDNEQPIHPQVNRARVPKYRGMMWVICEDDLENPDKDLRILVHRPSNLSSYASSEHYDDSSDSYFDDEDELDDNFDDSSSDSFGELMSPDSTTTYTKEPVVRPVSASQMDLDIQYNDGSDDVDDLHHNAGVVEIVEIGADDKHMHPVQHRALHPLPTPIRTTDLPNSHHSKSPTTTTTTASGFSSSPLTDNGTEPSTALTEPESDDRCHSLSPSSHEQTERHSSPPRILGSRHLKHTSSSSRKTPPPPPPILTSTFRACDLLRPVRGSETSSHSKPHEYTRSGANRAAGGAQTEADCADDQKIPSQEDDDGEWEFVPLHVPEGISLRNFGIQVPILTSVSDIIIYSPNATGAAQSANALRLARRFKQAVERKRRERVGCKADNTVTAAPSDTSAAHSTESNGAFNDSNTPLDYNVFLLDANAEEIKREMPHLVVKLCPEGEVPGSLGAALAGTSKSNYLSLFHHDEDGDVVMAENCDASISDPPVSNTSTRVKTVPNTVDFAQREKDEMRDLTRASEIVSMFPEGHTLAYLNPDPLHPPVYVQPSSHQIPTPNGNEVDLSNTKTFWNPHVGQVYLGNANDVPLPVNGMGEFGELDPRWDGHDSVEKDVYPPGNSPRHGYGYDICIECHDLAPFPTLAHLKASEEKVAALEQRWKDQVELSRKEKGETQANYSLPPRPPPHPNAIIHLPMPSSPPITAGTISALMPVVRFLQKCIVPTDAIEIVNEPPISLATETSLQNGSAEPLAENMKSRRWSSVSSLIPSFPGFPMHSNNPPPQTSPSSTSSSTTSTSRHRSMTSPAPPAHLRQRSPTSSMHSRHTSLSYLASSSHASPFPWSRPLKILMYSADGYTESSVPALCLLMAMKGLSLPHAYLELQVAKRRSFFVYHADLGVLRKVESFVDDERRTWKEEIQKEEKRLRLERERMERLKNSKDQRAGEVSSSLFGGSTLGFDFPTHMNPYRTWGSGDSSSNSSLDSSRLPLQPNRMRPMAKSVSFTRSPFIASSKGGSDSSMGTVTAIPTQQDLASRSIGTGGLKGSVTLPMSSSAPSSSMTSLDGIGETSSVSAAGRTRRPRASTSPWLPSLFGGDHLSWFNDPRFDGSFPSRVLPFLYLGNLAHASNVYMLQALGITHVVSVGECALVPPDSHNARGHGSSGNNSQGSGHFIPSKSSAHQGSLWIEERAGRIKVLDIQGVCDDGIDTLEPQLEPICDWIDQARQEGGQVLVHCRVGVSRSATVTIAYVMKHLSLPLVDAYLIVRSRRLSVLIQPNMRLLYNLLGWEIKLAKDRAGNDDEKLRKELSCALSWPFLAKEVHALNEKYLH
ncbi:hypothetical protein C8R41DRAFT_581669 [Lentinula lateritia]|uniref:Protein-tyrosine-phosphatase n=1 Tax=Lentinula lateritia TaxID=40482 RepID=A0ABQ8V663_9AGAR|nr:hypothetical protein C8R41DRAFT_581669 [Lentinula lateritia]